MSKELLSAIYITALIMSNLTANRIGSIGSLSVAGNPLAYIACFFVCDLMHEIYGKKDARKLVNYGFIGVVFSLFFIYVCYLIPAQDDNFNNAFKMVFNNSWRVLAASLITYMVSNHTDISLFSHLKKTGLNFIICKAVSTFISQFIDSALFCILAFAGSMGGKELFALILSEYLIKFVVNCIDMPFYSAIVHRVKR